MSRVRHSTLPPALFTTRRTRAGERGAARRPLRVMRSLPSTTPTSGSNCARRSRAGRVNWIATPGSPPASRHLGGNAVNHLAGQLEGLLAVGQVELDQHHLAHLEALARGDEDAAVGDVAQVLAAEGGFRRELDLECSRLEGQAVPSERTSEAPSRELVSACPKETCCVTWVTKRPKLGEAGLRRARRIGRARSRSPPARRRRARPERSAGGAPQPRLRRPFAVSGLASNSAAASPSVYGTRGSSSAV